MIWYWKIFQAKITTKSRLDNNVKEYRFVVSLKWTFLCSFLCGPILNRAKDLCWFYINCRKIIKNNQYKYYLSIIISVLFCVVMDPSPQFTFYASLINIEESRDGNHDFHLFSSYESINCFTLFYRSFIETGKWKRGVWRVFLLFWKSFFAINVARKTRKSLNYDVWSAR